MILDDLYGRHYRDGGIAGMGILGIHDEERIGREKITASHAGGFDAQGEIELVAVADVDEAKLEQFGEAWEAADPDLIWCEKPIASAVTEAHEMVTACEEKDTELLVNHSFRFTEKLQQLCTLVQEDGILGEPLSVTAQFRMELLRNSTHLLDTLVYLLDSLARTVSGYVNGTNEAVEDLEAAREVDNAGGGGFVVIDDGTFVTIDCTIPRDSSSMTLQFIGDAGQLT